MAAAPSDRRGALIAIGGHEARDGEVLRQTLQAAPARARHRVALLTAASGEPAALWRSYAPALQALGAEPTWLDVRDRAAADAAATLQAIEQADLVFMTGGDQERLCRRLHGSAAHRLLRARQREAGLAIAGTSAGASVLGSWMPGGDVADDGAAVLARPGAAAPHGLGLAPGLVIDQHFSQRQRLARLIDLAARHGLVGLGLDEDTAIVLQPGGLRVVGRRAVTLVDCRRSRRRAGAQAGSTPPSLRGVDLYRLEAGTALTAAQAAALGLAGWLR
jgi:cyanophycinase